MRSNIKCVVYYSHNKILCDLNPIILEHIRTKTGIRKEFEIRNVSWNYEK